MKISEVAMIGAKFAYDCCNNASNLNACGYASSANSLWGKFERAIDGNSIKRKESGFKSEIFCVALGSFLKQFYNYFLDDNEDSAKASFLILYVWHHFPVTQQEWFFNNSVTRSIRFCMSTREYMFFKHPYDSDKLRAFLENTIWFIDSGSINMDSERGQNINRMLINVRANAHNKASSIIKSYDIIDDIGFTKATSEMLDYD